MNDYALMATEDGHIELHIIDVPTLSSIAKVTLTQADARQLVAGVAAKLRAVRAMQRG